MKREKMQNKILIWEQKAEIKSNKKEHRRNYLNSASFSAGVQIVQGGLIILIFTSKQMY
jgi:hypothetical protein